MEEEEVRAGCAGCARIPGLVLLALPCQGRLENTLTCLCHPGNDPQNPRRRERHSGKRLKSLHARCKLFHCEVTILVEVGISEQKP